MAQQHIKLAQTLHPRLTRFFARYPPPTLQPAAAQALLAANSVATATSNASLDSTIPAANTAEPPYPNPFQSQKHVITGVWHDPIFSLRRQAELVKLARQHGVEELLPFTVKGSEEKLRRKEENGLRVKGTGIGQKVKGKMWERAMKGKLEKRRQAMLEMPQMVEDWKRRGHGRGWKKWPK